MVLWEITLVTAYCLGLRRTYRLALRLQRRIVPRRFPRVRDFLYRRTRNVFDVALAVHKRIQQRDISTKKSFGNYVLRVLDRARPSANITGKSDLKQLRDQSRFTRSAAPSDQAPHNKFIVSHPEKYRSQIGQAIRNRFSIGTGRNFPGVQNSKPESGMRPYSNLALSSELRTSFFPHRSVFRDDISKWMAR